MYIKNMHNNILHNKNCTCVDCSFHIYWEEIGMPFSKANLKQQALHKTMDV